MSTIAKAKSKVKKIWHILNPRAGKGKAKKIKEDLDKKEESVYMSKSVEDASSFIENECRKEPNTCFTVYGGDGTIFRTVNSLMKSGKNEEVTLKIVPMGSGNDFVHSFEDVKGEVKVDVMQFNDKYAINVINVGFDCEVVKRTVGIKKIPLVSGKMAYILGVAGEFLTKKPIDAKITLTYENGTTEVIEEEILLAAVANGKWYGGGFKVAPLSRYDDGLLDVEIIRNVGRMKFVKLVSDYKKGNHLDPETQTVAKGFEEYIYHRRCVAVKIEGIKSVCADGEIFAEESVDIKVIPGALNYIPNEEAEEVEKNTEALLIEEPLETTEKKATDDTPKTTADND